MSQLIARDPKESNRAATPLELLFDLCFVVAIAQAAASLHHAIVANHVVSGVFAYCLVFFAIWWAWMGYTWFASAFDNDDPVYRLTVLIQMTGMLAVAAGVPRAFNELDYGLITLGYTIIRVGMVALWIRAGAANSSLRTTARRYAVGLTLCQTGWIAIAFLEPEFWLLGFFILAPAELLVPVFAERAHPTPWHGHHISERYSLLLIIVVGESVLAATLSIQSAIDSARHAYDMLPVILGAPLSFFAMWWIYFSVHSHADPGTSRQTFAWGYLHYIVYGAAAAVGAAIGVLTDYYGHHAQISSVAAGMAMAIPAAIFVTLVAIAQARFVAFTAGRWLTFLLSSVLILVSGLVPGQPLGTAIILSIVTAILVFQDRSN